MGEQIEFTWVMNKFSSLQEERRRYSRPFAVADCNWHLFVHQIQKGDRNDLALYLELANPESLPLGWKREVKFSLTLVNKGWGKSNHVLGAQCVFDAKNNAWGYNAFISLTKLHAKGEGFLVNNKLIILAKAHVLPAAIVLPEQPVKIIEPQSSKEGNQASVSKSQGDSPCQVAQETDNVASQENLDDDDASEEGTDDGDDDASEESLDDDDASQEDSDDDDDDDASQEDSDDDDDDASEESLDDDDAPQEDPDDDNASTPVYDDGGSDISPLNQSNALEEASHTIGNHGIRCNSVAAETEVSNGENDDAPKEDVGDEASSHVANDSSRNGSTIDHVKSLEDASLTVENCGRGLNTVTSGTGTSDNVLMEIQPVKETMDVNGFEVFSSQVESVSHIFKRHPDIALGFRPKNQQIRRAYMDALLSLIEMLCQSPEKLSENDLSNADNTLVDLIDVGFKLDWLKTKLNEISEKKKMVQGSGARVRAMEEQLQTLKQMFLDLESQVQKEKVEALASRAPLSFNDVVC